MAKKRYINTKFWSDNFVVEINPLDRYLFLYFLTNEHTNIAGIYELPIRTMAFETGIDRDMLPKMLERLKEKIHYKDGWVIIKNFSKHQAENESVNIGIKRVLAELPEKVVQELDKVGIHSNSLSTACTPPATNLNLNLDSNLNSITAKAEKKTMKPFEEPTIEIDDSGEEVETKSKSKTFGRYPSQIAKFYCELTGKRSAGRQLPAAKELMQIFEEDFPDHDRESALRDIKQRIKNANKYYKANDVTSWNLSKVAENWDKFFKV